MNVIEFRLCDEDRARLDDIIAGLAALVPPGAMSDAATAVLEVKTGKVPPLLPLEGDAHLQPVDPPAPAPDPAPAPAPEVKPVPLPEFQKAIVTRCAESPAMKAKVQALVHKYAESVSAIPEGKRAAVLAELAAL